MLANLALRLVLLALPIAASAATPAVKPDSAKEAKTFLLRYTGLTSTSDVAALNMYRDDARVQIWSWQGGKSQPGQVSGKEWKQRLRSGWFDGTTKLEASSFEGAKVIEKGQRLVIQARRYSQTRCYWDNGYAVAIEPDAAGQYQIVEERISFQRDATCPANNDAASMATAAPATPVAATVLPVGHGVPVAPGGGPAGATKLPPNIVPRGQIPRIPPPSNHVAGPAGAPVPSSK